MIFAERTSMTAGSERVPIDHTDRRVEVRVDVCISGKFALANKRDAKGDRRKFACRATNISQSAIVLLTPIAGAIGERVIAYFQEFGELNGAISRIFVGGFVMRVVVNDKDRATFREKLLWLQAGKNLKVFDRVCDALPSISVDRSDRRSLAERGLYRSRILEGGRLT
jgi:hypothetical protein